MKNRSQIAPSCFSGPEKLVDFSPPVAWLPYVHKWASSRPKSLIIMIKSQGPNLVPRGIPDGTDPYIQRHNHQRVWLSENGGIENRLSNWLYLLVGPEIVTYWLKYYDQSGWKPYDSQNEWFWWWTHFRQWPLTKCGAFRVGQEWWKTSEQHQTGCYLVLAEQLVWHNHRQQSPLQS